MALKMKPEKKITPSQSAFIMSHQGGKRTDTGIFSINPRDAVLITAVRSKAPLSAVRAALSDGGEEARQI